MAQMVQEITEYFPVLPFTFPLLEYLSFLLTECVLFYHFAAFFILLYIAMLLVFQPFKLFKHNIILTSMLVTVLLLCWSMIIYNTDSADKHYLYFSVIIISLSLSFLPLYVAIIVCFWFKKKCFLCNLASATTQVAGLIQKCIK